ncbi:ribokinase [Mesoplasma syrphidae]|uniref:Ribokinase n=1 Tax=Mesoplasma syrphidae TaxID=225999 RepID=A0A2K9C1B4_9MOLU|nr:ribokinase [Mesoplasma syrphidae]AUF83269.1 ribokinase [Mesoplasma syrphidae]
MHKIVVIGSLNVDSVFKVKKIPKPGATIFSSSFEYHFGGKGANQAYTIGKLGGDVELLGVVGNDEYGSKILQHLNKEANVKIDQIRVSSKFFTGMANIIVDDFGDNQIIVHSGANFDFDSKYLETIKKVIDLKEIIILQLEIPLNIVEDIINYAHEQQKIVILNPAPVQSNCEKFLSKVDYLIPNETELEILMNQKFESQSQFLEAAQKFVKEKHIKNLIVTLGAAGSYLITQNVCKFINVYKANAVDSTCAGDSYLGAFATKLSQGIAIEDALDYAALVSAIVVTKNGAQSSIPSQEEIEKVKLFK